MNCKRQYAVEDKCSSPVAQKCTAVCNHVAKKALTIKYNNTTKSSRITITGKHKKKRAFQKFIGDQPNALTICPFHLVCMPLHVQMKALEMQRISTYESNQDENNMKSVRRYVL